jgi:hypothetical protein
VTHSLVHRNLAPAVIACALVVTEVPVVIDAGDPGRMSAMPPTATDSCGAAIVRYVPKDDVIGRQLVDC